MAPVRSIAVKLVLGVVALVVVAALASGFVLWRASDDLSAGRDALVAARRELVAGDPGRAASSFQVAQARFSAAGDAVGGPIGTFAAIVPAIGNHVEVARAVADAGLHGAKAGALLTDALADSPGGIDTLAPSGGRLPLDRYEQLADVAATASAEGAMALEAIEGAPTTFLLRSVLQERLDAEADVRSANRALAAGATLLETLPDFAGADERKRYLVVSVNPAELRGTGGLWGSYAIMKFSQGETSVGPAEPVQSLPDVSVDDIPAPSPDYRAAYDQFGGASSWQNMNMTPDFPSAARAALGNMEAGGGPALDGVIAADPVALQSMLKVTGPYQVPGTDLKIDADSVLDFMLNEAYGLFPVKGASAERKRVLGAVGAGIFERFLSLDGRTMQRLRVLGDAVAEGHVKMYSVDEPTQEAFELAGVAGSFGPGEGDDIVAVTVNNGSGNKVDQWERRAVDYEVTLGGDGQALATLTTELANDAPTDGAPRYVLGPFVKGIGPGDQRPIVSVSCPATCEMRGATLDGGTVMYHTGTELGTTWFRTSATVEAGSSTVLEVAWTASDAWTGNDSTGSYRFTYPAQSTLRSTELSVTIHAPQGTRIVWTNVPMVVEGATASWEGKAGPSTELEVQFRAPLPLRWLRDLSRAMGG